MKIKLLDIGEPRTGLGWEPFVDKAGRWAVPSLSLVHLASLVRDHDEVEIIDEKVHGPIGNIDADLVGITYKTMFATRAYALADRLREQGIIVVMGGVHATQMPHEAAQHADAVVVGEGESTWPRVLADAENGSLKQIYQAPTPRPPLSGLRLRMDALDHSKYMLHTIQSSRGCTFHCEFCPTAAITGPGVRLRDIDAVANEAKELLRLDNKPILFSENVFGGGSMPFIRDLTGRLADMNASYGVICDFPMLRQRVIDALAAGGCKLIVLNLTGVASDDEVRAVDAIHDAGMGVWGFYMFGFEQDTPDVFANTVKMVRRTELEYISLTLLAPYPGTPMGKRLTREGRVFDFRTEMYDQAHVVFDPKLMTREQFQGGWDHVTSELADLCHFDNAVQALHGIRAPAPLAANAIRRFAPEHTPLAIRERSAPPAARLKVVS